MASRHGPDEAGPSVINFQLLQHIKKPDGRKNRPEGMNDIVVKYEMNAVAGWYIRRDACLQRGEVIDVGAGIRYREAICRMLLDQAANFRL